MTASDEQTAFEIAADAAQKIMAGPRHSDGKLPPGYITHIIEQVVLSERTRAKEEQRDRDAQIAHDAAAGIRAQIHDCHSDIALAERRYAEKAAKAIESAIRQGT